MMFTKFWCYYTRQQESVKKTSAHQDQMSLVFANHSNKDVIYPLTVREIAQAQKLDASLKKQKDMYFSTLVENSGLCKDGKMVISAVLHTIESIGITTTCNTLDTQDLKKHFTP